MKLTLEETRQIKVLLNQARSLANSMKTISLDESVPPLGRYSSFPQMALMYNDLAVQANRIIKTGGFYTFNTDIIPTWSNTVWPVGKAIFEQILLSVEMLCSTLAGHLDFIDDEFENLSNFISSRLRAAIFEKPEKEIEIQNAVETLLLGRGLSKGIDYDRESGKLEFSGREYIPDFVLPRMGLSIEVKLLKEGKRSKIIEEISADVTAYAKSYARQLFIVYDLGVIRDESEFRRDIENAGDIKVLIIKH